MASGLWDSHHRSMQYPASGLWETPRLECLPRYAASGDEEKGTIEEKNEIGPPSTDLELSIVVPVGPIRARL